MLLPGQQMAHLLALILLPFCLLVKLRSCSGAIFSSWWPNSIRFDVMKANATAYVQIPNQWTRYRDDSAVRSANKLEFNLPQRRTSGEV